MSCTILSMVGATCLTILTYHCSLLTMASLLCRVGCKCFFHDCYTLMATILTITPFVIHVGNYHLAFSAQACILQLFQAYHSESVFSKVYRYLPNLLITRVTQAPLCSYKRITTTDGLSHHI